MRQPDITVGPFRERDSVLLTGVFKDNATPPIPIPGSALLSATLTLYSEQFITDNDGAVTYPIINSRDHVDIKTSVDDAGAFSFLLAQADMAMVDANASPLEYHRALVEWIWNVDKRGSYEIRIVVRDVVKVGAAA